MEEEVNLKKSSADGFEFRHFPEKWPLQCIRVSNIKLTDDQIQELRDLNKHRDKIAKQHRQSPQEWEKYFGLAPPNSGRYRNGFLRDLASRQKVMEEGGLEKSVGRERRMKLRKLFKGDQDAGGSSVVQSDDTHQQVEMHEDEVQITTADEVPITTADEVPILKQFGGSNLLVQLTKGDPAAQNSKARNRPFARNRGPLDGKSDQDFSRAAEDVVINPEAFHALGLHIFLDFPKLEERNGDRSWLVGVDCSGVSLALQMSKHPHDLVMINMVAFTTRFLESVFAYNEIVKTSFEKIVTRLLDENLIPREPVDHRLRLRDWLQSKLYVKARRRAGRFTPTTRSHCSISVLPPFRSWCRVTRSRAVPRRGSLAAAITATGGGRCLSHANVASEPVDHVVGAQHLSWRRFDCNRVRVHASLADPARVDTERRHGGMVLPHLVHPLKAPLLVCRNELGRVLAHHLVQSVHVARTHPLLPASRMICASLRGLAPGTPATGPTPGSVQTKPLPELMQRLANFLARHTPALEMEPGELPRRVQMVVCVFRIAAPEHRDGHDSNSHLERGRKQLVQIRLVEEQPSRHSHLGIHPPEGGQEVVQVRVRVVYDAAQRPLVPPALPKRERVSRLVPLDERGVPADQRARGSELQVRRWACAMQESYQMIRAFATGP